MTAFARKSTIEIVFAADANYVMPLAVAICSIAANCERNRRLVFNIIQRGIAHDLRAKIESSLKRIGFPDARINWLDSPLERIEGFKLAHRWTTNLTFARLLVQDLLPIEIEKVLYLDCDLVANEDIGELWDTELREKSLFAARDTIGAVGQPGGLANHRELGIPAAAPYFNAGVLLINLKKWREQNTGERVLSYLSTHRAVIQLADQEALNAILWNDWGELDYRWNWQIVWRNYRLGRAGAEMGWLPGTTRKSIVHFITAEKPWLPGCDYEEKKYFFEYLDRTAWAGQRVPWLKEIYGRSRRALTDVRNALGMVRRRVMPIRLRQGSWPPVS
jgi:lipopolysaccharide biosynthesis glycosyltransferase